MNPTKNTTDYYKTEMNQLFSRIDENEYLSTPHTSQSFSQSVKSSSSPETSPESFTDVMRELFPVGPSFLSPVIPNQSPAKPCQGLHSLGDNQQFDYLSTQDLDFTSLSPSLPQPLYETPLAKYREIVGRKIILENRFDDTKLNYEELKQTPPRQFYELFPTENRQEFHPLQNCTPPKVDFKSNLDLNLKYGTSNYRPRFNKSNDNSPSNQKSNNASPNYELPFDFSPNSQQMSNATTRFDRMSNDTSRFDRMSNNTSRSAGMSNDTLRFNRISNETPRFQGMSNDAYRYDRIIDDTFARFYQNPNDSPRYWQNMSNDLAMFDAMSNDTSMFDAMSNDTSMYDTMSNDALMFDTMSTNSSQYYQMSNYYSQNVSPVSRTRSNSTVSTQNITPFKEPLKPPSTSKNGNKMCKFCRKNGETPLVYMTHKVKEKIGNRTVVTCPILRSHICSSCGATGDDSHTISYCPIMRRSNNGQPLRSTTVSLKTTRVKSNGMVRRQY